MAASDGAVYAVSGYDLARIAADGSVRVLVHDLAERTWMRRLREDHHAIMGLWTDPQNNVYAAIHGDRVVKKVSSNGAVDVVARSEPPWRPTGGLVAANGDLWILEYSDRTRVRHILQEWNQPGLRVGVEDSKPSRSSFRVRGAR